jgi:hypothetical protein
MPLPVGVDLFADPHQIRVQVPAVALQEPWCIPVALNGLISVITWYSPALPG